MSTEATAINHCDEPSCDLGSVEYTCPKCGKRGTEYGDAWWFHSDVREGTKTVQFPCEHCNAMLVMSGKDHDLVVDVLEASHG